MRFLLNMIPLVLLAVLAICGIGFYSLEWELTFVMPCVIAVICSFVCSLAWRATPEGSARNLNGGLFLAAFVLSLLLVNDPSLIRSLWPFMTIAVFATIHCYLFEIARRSVIFSGGRIVLLALPIILNTIVVIGLFAWNGGLRLATIGFLVSVIFALLSTLFGYKRDSLKTDEDLVGKN